MLNALVQMVEGLSDQFAELHESFLNNGCNKEGTMGFDDTASEVRGNDGTDDSFNEPSGNTKKCDPPS